MHREAVPIEARWSAVKGTWNPGTVPDPSGLSAVLRDDLPQILQAVEASLTVGGAEDAMNTMLLEVVVCSSTIAAALGQPFTLSSRDHRCSVMP